MNNDKLIITTHEWQRNLESHQPGYWRTINSEQYYLPSDKSIQGKKRHATRIIFEIMTPPEDSEAFKLKTWWSNWKLDKETGNPYRMTANLRGTYMRAEIIEV